MIRKVKKYIEYFFGIPKTIIFNLKYFPFNIAILFPVFISNRVILKRLAGTVDLGIIKTGIVKIGFGDIPLIDSTRTKTLLNLSGSFIFRGSAEIGPGCSLGGSGKWIFGDGFRMTANSSIFADNRVEIGKNVIISWDVLIMDQDFHSIFNEKRQIINAPKAIVIGDKVWIGCRVMVLKGSNIRSGNIIAAGTTVRQSLDINNAILGEEIQLKVMRENVFWER